MHGIDFRRHARGTKQGRSTRRKQPPPTNINERVKLRWSANEAQPAPTTHRIAKFASRRSPVSIPVGSIRIVVYDEDAGDRRAAAVGAA